MKKVVAGLVFVLGMSQAHAIKCNLKKENPIHKGSYDQEVFVNLEVLKNGVTGQAVLVKPDNSIVENFDYRSIDTYEKWKAIDKSIVTVVTRSEGNLLSIGIGSVDISNKDNMLPMEALAVGKDAKQLGIMSLSKKLFLFCHNF